MATIAKLDVLLGLEDGAFTRGLESSRAKLDKWGSSLRSMGTKITAGVTAPIVGSGGVMVKWAADLEQTMGATEQLWDKNEDAIISWSEGANRSMGMTQNEALTSANRFNAMFKQIGAGEDVVADMSIGFTQMSADLSAMWGGSSIEASDALTSALRGNYEGLDKYNINLTEAMVNTRAMEVAVRDGRDEITEADKVMARYELINEQASDSVGQFGRETDTTAGKLAILRARVIDAGTKFGKLLLPYVNKAADAFSTIVTRLENLNDTQRKWILGIAAVAAALGPMLIIIGLLLPGLGALVAVIGFLLSPIGLVVLAVALLAAGLIYAYTHFEAFREIVDTVASTIKDVAVAAFDMLVDSFNKLKDAFGSGGFTELFATLGEMLLNGFIQLHVYAYEGVQALAQAFINAAPGLLSAGWSLIQSLADGAVGKWNEFTGWLSGIAPSVAMWVAITTGTLLLKGIELIQGLWNGAVAMWPSVQSWMAGLGASAIAAVGILITTLWQKGVDLLTGFFQGAVDRWATFTAWIATIDTLAFAAVGEVIGTLVSKGSNIIQGFWDGATGKWTTVRTWFNNLPSMINTAVGELWDTLKSKGSQILQGFWTGVIGKWQDVSLWFSTLGSKIVVAIPYLGGYLWDAGVQLMTGFIGGIQSMAQSVVNAALAPVHDAINGVKGLLGINSPSRVFMEIGHNTMLGLANGIGGSSGIVTGQMDSVARAVAGTDFSATHAGMNGANGIGGTVINHNYFVTPEALQEMIDGGKFARNFGSELGMMEGVG